MAYEATEKQGSRTRNYSGLSMVTEYQAWLIVNSGGLNDPQVVYGNASPSLPLRGDPYPNPNLPSEYMMRLHEIAIDWLRKDTKALVLAELFYKTGDDISRLPGGQKRALIDFKGGIEAREFTFSPQPPYTVFPEPVSIDISVATIEAELKSTYLTLAQHLIPGDVNDSPIFGYPRGCVEYVGYDTKRNSGYNPLNNGDPKQDHDIILRFKAAIPLPFQDGENSLQHWVPNYDASGAIASFTMIPRLEYSPFESFLFSGWIIS